MPSLRGSRSGAKPARDAATVLVVEMHEAQNTDEPAPGTPGDDASAPEHVSTHRDDEAKAAAPPGRGAPIVGVFGATERRGRWRPARTQAAVAVFGGVHMDLRHAELPPVALEVRAWAVFGGVRITLPEGVQVESTGGFSLFGGCHVDSADVPPAVDLPVVRLHAVAIFGGVRAKAERPPRP